MKEYLIHIQIYAPMGAAFKIEADTPEQAVEKFDKNVRHTIPSDIKEIKIVNVVEYDEDMENNMSEHELTEPKVIN